MQLQDLIKEIQALDIKTNRVVNDVFLGNYKSAFKGRGIEFADIRPYDYSDDYRDIDWRTSARQGELYVKQYHESRDLNTIVVMDVSSSMFFGTKEQTKFDQGLKVLATIAFSVLKNNDRIGGIFYADEIKELIPSKKGKGAVWNLLQKALLCRNQSETCSTKPKEVFPLFQNLFTKRSIVFWVSDDRYFLQDPANQKALKLINQRHELVFIHLTDPVEAAFPDSGVLVFEDLETKKKVWVDASDKNFMTKYTNERKKQLEDNSNWCIKNDTGYIEISTQDSVNTKLLHYFYQRAHQ